jgi:hypothetical protein
MPHVLFVYDRPDSLAAASEETRQEVYRDYEALADIPDMRGHRLHPGDPGTILTLTDEGEQPRLEPVATGDLQIIGFYLLATDDADRAVQLAGRIPAARRGGAIKIHRLADE